VKRLRLAIAGLTACSGCQLTLLNCEAELPELARRFSFAYFPLGASHRLGRQQFHAALVEGAVSTPADLTILHTLRERSQLLIAVGTCAIWGGIATLRHEEPRKTLLVQVYGPAGESLASFAPTPLTAHVAVDFCITGCPPESSELLAMLAALRHGTFPDLPTDPVCLECRSRELPCLLQERQALCLGPLTRGGCHARCPATGIQCEGCRGPASEMNVAAQLALFKEHGHEPADIISRLKRFAPEWDYERTM
jgi:coenzyme F420-reducing hydrogenase gamma subunit